MTGSLQIELTEEPINRRKMFISYTDGQPHRNKMKTPKRQSDMEAINLWRNTETKEKGFELLGVVNVEQVNIWDTNGR